MAQHDVADMPGPVEEILEAIQVLTHSPMIGRPVRDGKRELVIGKGTRGYIALYSRIESRCALDQEIAGIPHKAPWSH